MPGLSGMGAIFSAISGAILVLVVVLVTVLGAVLILPGEDFAGTSMLLVAGGVSPFGT